MANITRATCKAVLESKLSSIPCQWRGQIISALCSIVSDTPFLCEDVPDCETLTTISEFVVVDNQICITYTDEDGVENLRCFEIPDLEDVVITANSGLIKSSPTNVQLGGSLLNPSPLLKNSYITSNSFSITVSGLKLNDNGSAQLIQYGNGTFLDTPTYLLGVDGLGNVIETTPDENEIVITADNGLSKDTPTNVQLGGSLLHNTTILANTFDITISGLKLEETGAAQLTSYGIGTFTGTETFFLAVDATGHVIEQNNVIVTADNGLTKNTPSNVQLGGTLLHNTTNNTNTFVHTLSGATVYEYPYNFRHQQHFENGTGVVSFWNNGSLVGTEPDTNNLVRLGINYSGAVYDTNVVDLYGYFKDKIGYSLGVNWTGHGSFGAYVDDPASKTGGIFIHTLDSSFTDMVTIYGKHPTTNNSDVDISAGATGFHDFRLATFHDDGALTLYKYGVGTFQDTPIYSLGVLADGSVIEFTPDDAEILITADNALTKNTPTNVQLGSPISGGAPLLHTSYIDHTGGDYQLIFEGDSGNGAPLLYAHGGVQGALLQGSTVGVTGQADSIPLWGVNTSVAGATVVQGLTLNRNPSSGVAASGLGTSIQVNLPNSIGSVSKAGDISIRWSDATNGSTTASLNFGLQNLGAASTRKASLAGDGQWTWDDYGTGTFQDVPIYSLGVLADGTVIEFTPTDAEIVITADNGLSKDTPTNVQLGGPVSLPAPLLHDSYILNDGFTMVFQGNQVPAILQGLNGGSGVGVVGTSVSGNGVQGISTSNNGMAGSSTSGTGVRASSSSGIGLFAISTNSIGADININPTSTATVAEIARFERTTQNTASDGIGGSLTIYVEDDSGNSRLTNELISKWSTAATVTRVSQLAITGVDAAATQTLVTIDGDGQSTFYGPSNPTYTVYAINTTGIGVRSETTTGVAVYGISTLDIGGRYLGSSYGVYSEATISGGVGVRGNALSTSGVAVGVFGYTQATTGSALGGLSATSDTSAVLNTLTLSRSTSGTAVAGIGQKITFSASTTVAGQQTNEIISKWTDPTSATRTSEFSVTGVSNATIQTLLTISGPGIFTLTQGLSNFADDAAAAVGGIPVNGLYRTASAVKIRVS